MPSNCGIGEDSWESPLDSKEIKSVNLKGNQPWIFIGRTDAEAEAPILWPPDGKSQLTGKDPDAGKDWRQEEKEMTEDEVVGWHHWLNGHAFEQTLGDGEGQGSLACWPVGLQRVGHDWVTEQQALTIEDLWRISIIKPPVHHGKDLGLVYWTTKVFCIGHNKGHNNIESVFWRKWGELIHE